MEPKFSKEDEDFVRDNYNVISVEEMSDHIGKCTTTVYNIISLLGIGRYHWTEKRVDILRKYYKNKGWDFLFYELENYNKESIISKASELGIRKRILWDDEKDKILKKYFPSSDWDSMFLELNTNSKNGINHRAKKLGLCATEHFWSEEEISLLKELYPHYSNKYLSRKIFTNRASYSIRTMGRKLGLYKTKEKGMKSFDPIEIIEQLADLGRILNRTPAIDELISNGLPSDGTYRRYFGGYKEACKLAGLEINVSLWGNAKTYISSVGDICYSKSELLITDFFIKNKIFYRKDVRYSDIISDERCRTKTVDWIIGDNVFVEYWGYPKIDTYIIGVDCKRSICKNNEILLVELTRKEIKRLNDIFKDFINVNL